MKRSLIVFALLTAAVIAADPFAVSPLTNRELRKDPVPVTIVGPWPAPFAAGTTISLSPASLAAIEHISIDNWPTSFEIADSTTGAQVLASAPGGDTGQRGLAVRIISSLATGGGGGGSGGTEYDEDTPSFAGDKLTMAGVVRKDTAATLVGTDGDRTQLQVDAVGRLHVNGSGVTQPISASALPLPAGAALDATVAARLAESTFTTRFPVKGQAAMAASVPVAIASDQPAIPVSASALPLPDGAGTDATLATRLAETTFTGRTGEVQASPTANTVLGRLKSVEDKLDALQTELNQKTEPANTQTIAGTVQPGNTANTTAWLFKLDQTGANNDVDILTMPAITGTVTANAGTNLNTSALALESGGNLAAVAAKDFATQATLAQIKSKTDNIDVALSTRTKPADTQAVGGTVTANIGTTAGLALDATLTGGTQKAIARGGAKGVTAAADLTSTAEGTDHQAIDVQLYHGGTAKDPTAIRALTSSDNVTANAGTNLNTSALALESGGNLAAVAAKDFATQASLATRLSESTFTTRIPLNGQATMANSVPVVLASNQTTVTIGGNTGAGSPSPTTILTVQGHSSGTPIPVTANAGTNLNTSALAVESGGNLATIVARMPAGASPADAESNTITSLSRTGAFGYFFNGTTWDRWRGAVTNTNLDVALSTRLKPADTLAGITTLTNLLQLGGVSISAQAAPTGGVGVAAIPVNTNAQQKATYAVPFSKLALTALVANTRRDILSLEHAGTATKTVRIRRILLGALNTTAVAGDLKVFIYFGTAASSAGTGITPTKAIESLAAAEVTCKSVPTITAATLKYVSQVDGVAATANTVIPQTVIYDWLDSSDQIPLTLRSGTLESIVVAVESVAANIYTVSGSVIVTEE